MRSHRHAEVVRLIDGGKRVGGAIYVHMSLLSEQVSTVQDLVLEAFGLAGPEAAECNVMRVSMRRPEVALLRYPEFFEEPFPALQTS